ncbi:hypothetical protein JTB14_025716 [Gonioctena quinquepunctata]|nr:hypothetical protein JTB14_025716 [Gonioctena quinquepunctata]
MEPDQQKERKPPDKHVQPLDKLLENPRLRRTGKGRNSRRPHPYLKEKENYSPSPSPGRSTSENMKENIKKSQLNSENPGDKSASNPSKTSNAAKTFISKVPKGKAPNLNMGKLGNYIFPEEII